MGAVRRGSCSRRGRRLPPLDQDVQGGHHCHDDGDNGDHCDDDGDDGDHCHDDGVAMIQKC